MVEIVDSKPQRSCLLGLSSIVALPALFLIALSAGYVGLLPFYVPLYTLVIVAFIFLVFVAFARHNAAYSACKIRNDFHKMEEALREQLQANTLTIMGKSKSTLDIAEFAENYYKDIRNDNFAKVASSVFPMLGILGTFVAIAVSMPDFTVKDLDALDREISVMLSGIGTAFYASIYGIALSLIWTFFEKRGQSRIDKNIYDLEKLYDRHIWKKAELIKHEHMQNALKDKEIVLTLKETFNLDFIREMNDQYTKHFTTIVSEATSGFTEVSKRMQTVVAQLRDTTEKIYAQKEGIDAVEEMRRNIEAFNDTAYRLERALQRFDDTVDRTFEKIDEEVGGIVEKLAAFARIVSEQNKVVLKTLSELKKSGESDIHVS